MDRTRTHPRRKQHATMHTSNGNGNGNGSRKFYAALVGIVLAAGGAGTGGAFFGSSRDVAKIAESQAGLVATVNSIQTALNDLKKEIDSRTQSRYTSTDAAKDKAEMLTLVQKNQERIGDIREALAHLLEWRTKVDEQQARKGVGNNP